MTTSHRRQEQWESCLQFPCQANCFCELLLFISAINSLWDHLTLKIAQLANSFISDGLNPNMGHGIYKWPL